MFVGIARITLRLPGAQSLKDRRRVINGYKDRLKARLSVSVAEVGSGDDHHSASLGVALVARDAGEATELLARVVAVAEQIPEALVVDSGRRVLPWRPEWSGPSWSDLDDDPPKKG